ncbi:MAG: permease-like cell division protein FtsX [Patescibacteria group bacterium]
MLLSLARMIKFAFQNFWRNIWLSVVTITIIFLTLCSLTSLILLNVISEQALTSVKSALDIAITFKPVVPQMRVEEVQDILQGLPYLSLVTLTTAEESLSTFRTNHAQDPTVIKTLNALTENPFGATLTLRLSSLDYYQTLLKRIDEMELTKDIERMDTGSYERIVARIEDLSGRVRTLGYVVSGFFALIAILIVFNAIRMGIYSHRDEISIMRLVGATNGFIRGPFLIEALLYTILSCAIFWAVALPFLNSLTPSLNEFLSGIGFNLRGYLTSHLGSIVGFELILILLLTSISSMIAMAKYLKV